MKSSSTNLISRICLILVAIFAFRPEFTANAAAYALGPDSQRQADIPVGRVEKCQFAASRIFPGTVRDYWVYVPAQYEPAQPACVMIFQDGQGYENTNGDWRVPIVFDNLIAKKEMPVTIGIFINPGVVPPSNTNSLPRFNRSLEYDGLGDHYARFLLEEILPEVGNKYNLASDGNSRAIAGLSSGAICAFNAAWERPEAFSRVLSAIGTYVGLRGGNEFPTLIRKTEPKPIRVFLQDGANDLNIYGGSWWLANQEMLSALEFSGYEVDYVWGQDGHSGRQGGAVLPDALRWLWKDYPAPIQADVGSRQPVMDILSIEEGWQMVATDSKNVDGVAANGKGEVFFSAAGQIYKVDLSGHESLFVTNTPEVHGEMFGPDGCLYVCQKGSRRIVKYSPDGNEIVVAEDLDCNDICVLNDGKIYASDPLHQQIWLVLPDRRKQVVDRGFISPNGVRATPDQTFLIVDDSRDRFVYSYGIEPDGSLTNKQPYYHLHVADESAATGAAGMTLDTEGRLYVATSMGIQVCDQAGRVIGIISSPQPGPLRNMVFGGANHDELFVTCSDKEFVRKTKAHGVFSWQTPFTPPAPKL
jgi:sugar lactone lactonase YvrE/enterochelin esterase-like enzyme